MQYAFLIFKFLHYLLYHEQVKSHSVDILFNKSLLLLLLLLLEASSAGLITPTHRHVRISSKIMSCIDVFERPVPVTRAVILNAKSDDVAIISSNELSLLTAHKQNHCAHTLVMDRAEFSLAHKLLICLVLMIK